MAPGQAPPRMDKEGPNLVGVQDNIKKTSEFPVQNLIYLGIQLDLKALTLSLPLEKITKLRNLCKLTSTRQQVSRADLEGLLGLVTFSYSVIPSGGCMRPL